MGRMWGRGFVALAAVSALVAAACGGDDAGGDVDGGSDPSPPTVDETDETPGDDSEPDDGATDGGEAGAPSVDEVDLDATLRVAWTTMPTQLDPHMSRIEPVDFRTVTALVYDRLFTVSPDRTLRGLLVTDWNVSDDGLALTLELRDGVTFRDGTPLDAEAVQVNLERARTIDGPVVPARISALETVEVVDDLTVRLNLERPDPGLPYVLAENAGAIIHPDLIASGDPATETNGSGPYVIESFTPAEELVLVRDADGYWDEDAAKFARIEHLRIQDPSAMVSAMEGGQIDMAQFFPWTVGSIEGTPGLHVERMRENSSIDLHLNRLYAPLDVVEVRQAINLALDRDAIVEALYPGSEPKTSNFRDDAPGGLPGYLPYEHDPGRARELLADAGFGDGVDLGAMLVPPSVAPGTGDAIQAMLADVGIAVEVRPADSGEIFSTWTEAEHSMMVNFANMGSYSAAGMHSRWGPANNAAGLTPEYEELRDAALEVGLSDAEHADRVADLNRYVVDAAWAAPLLWMNFPWVVNERIVGFSADEPDYSTTIGPYDLRYVGMAPA